MRESIRRVLSRPVGVLVASVAVVVMGALSFLNIPLQLLPDGFESRHLTIWARLRDSSPQESERHVAIPVEEALGTVAGIESVSTRCDRDSVRISLEMKGDADPATVERDVRDRVARVENDLPDDVDRLRVRREGPADMPVLFFACTADLDPLELSDFVEEVLLPRIEAIDGVARASAWGTLRRAVRIQLDQEEVARRNLDLREVLRRLRGDNLSVDLGDVEEGGRKAFLRASMEFDSLDEIRDFPVVPGLRLGEIADVSVRPGYDQGLSRYNGNAVIVGTVYKTAGMNTVAVCRRTRELFEDFQAGGHGVPDLKLTTFWDQGNEIEKALQTLYENALYGGALAVVVLFVFFRRLRMTVLVAAAIPLSLTIAVTALYLGGDSLNVLTLAGLTLAVGMLIDNAIVVVEAILRRREAGDTPREAAAGGTGEVALAIATATLTTLVVFLPAIFLTDDQNARIMLTAVGRPIGLALLASLAVALVLVPLGSVYLRRDRRAALPEGHAGWTRHDRYGRLLGFALRHRFAVLLLATLLCASAAVPFTALGRQAAMGRARGPVRVMLRFPRHFELRDANEAVKLCERFVLDRLDEFEMEGIYARFDKYGGMAMMWRSPDAERPQEEVKEEIRKGWPQIPGVWTSLESAGEEGRTTVRLEGEDPDQLERTMARIEQRLARLPSVSETKREREQGLQELLVSVDPEAVERGQVVPEWIRGMLGWVLRGARLRDFRSESRDLPLLLELDPEQAVEVRDLGALRIPTEQGMKPLGTLAKLGVQSAPAAIERRDGRRVAEMEVLGKEEDQKKFHEEVQAVLRTVELPPGVRFKVAGSWEDLQQSFGELTKALMLGVLLVFLLTGILFEELLLPLAILFAIPAALTGAVWALHITGKPLDEVALVGGILLVGVVVNNAIVLIDRVQQHRRTGLPLKASVRAAGRDRLRPVVMTACTTIVGLLPMAVFKAPENMIQYDTLATAVIGGLVVSTVVTLLLVPVVFTLFADLQRAIVRVLRAAAGVVSVSRPRRGGA